jgi:hypothetical protein
MWLVQVADKNIIYSPSKRYKDSPFRVNWPIGKNFSLGEKSNLAVPFNIIHVHQNVGSACLLGQCKVVEDNNTKIQSEVLLTT